jgi:hypothetical protein
MSARAQNYELFPSLPYWHDFYTFAGKNVENTMRKTLFLVPLLICYFSVRSFAQAEGQTYTNAVGIKFFPTAISFKHFLDDNTALEGLASFWNSGFRVTGLYELYGDISSDIPGFRWYVGPGAHVGAFGSDRYRGRVYTSGELSIGIDGIAGVEYKFSGAPIAVSADLQPLLELNGPYVDLWGGIGVKYTW